MFDGAHTRILVWAYYDIGTAKNMSPDQYSVVYCGSHSYLGFSPLNSIGTLWIRSNIVNPHII